MNTNFAGIPEEFSKKETSKIVITPVEYYDVDEIKKGVTPFFNQAKYQELYDIETESEPYKQGIYSKEKLVFDNAENTSDEIYNISKKHILTNKFPILISNAPLVNIGSIKAFNEHFENLSVLHIDASARLHKQINNKKVHNKCAMYHASQVTNLVQVGIRNISKIETTVIDKEKTFFADEMVSDDYWIENVIDSLTQNVVVSLNIDALDPSIAPGVDNPIHGGLFWYETLTFLKSVFTEKNIVGINLTGLNIKENDIVTSALACKLFYKMIAYKFNSDIDNKTIIDE